MNLDRKKKEAHKRNMNKRTYDQSITHKVVLHLSDWNNQDKYYRTNEAIIDQLAQRLRAGSFGDAWDWFTGQVNYGKGKDPNKPIKSLGNPRVSDIEETVFLDYFNIQECLDEWYD